MNIIGIKRIYLLGIMALTMSMVKAETAKITAGNFKNYEFVSLKNDVSKDVKVDVLMQTTDLQEDSMVVEGGLSSGQIEHTSREVIEIEEDTTAKKANLETSKDGNLESQNTPVGVPKYPRWSLRGNILRWRPSLQT